MLLSIPTRPCCRTDLESPQISTKSVEKDVTSARVGTFTPRFRMNRPDDSNACCVHGARVRHQTSSRGRGVSVHAVFLLHVSKRHGCWAGVAGARSVVELEPKPGHVKRAFVLTRYPSRPIWLGFLKSVPEAGFAPGGGSSCR